MSIFGHSTSDAFIEEVRKHRSFIANQESQGKAELNLLEELDSIDKEIIKLVDKITEEYGAQYANRAEIQAIEQKGYARENLNAYLSAIGPKRLQLLKDTRDNMNRVLEIILANRHPRRS